MSHPDCWDERRAAAQHYEEQRAASRLASHPNCSDPAHPGCGGCREVEQRACTDTDPMEGLRGMRHDDAKALIVECMRRAGLSSEEQLDVDSLGWNICFRVAAAAHTLGAKAALVARGLPVPEHTNLWEVKLPDAADPLTDAALDLKAVADAFEVTGPDADGLVWLVLRGSGTTGRAMVSLGSSARVAAQVALLLEEKRRAAVDKATGAAS